MHNTTIMRNLGALRCPITRGPLTLLSAAEIAVANEDLQAGRRIHSDGGEAPPPLTKALGTSDRAYLYRVEEDILWLLPTLALIASGHAAMGSFAGEKEIVQSFYNDFGWVKQSNGLYNDTVEFNETRSIARDYQRYCNARIGRLLVGGRRLLDVASGAIPHREYLDYSNGYETRICVDFSLRALREARNKLGERGLYILGDITALPLACDSIDAVISLHTIYHVPQAEQTAAVDELVRVTRPGGRVVIVYTWAHSSAMDIVFKLRGWLGWVRRLGRPLPAAVTAASAGTKTPPLYFHPLDHDWFVQAVAVRHSARLRVWSAVNRAFQTRFLANDILGRLTITAVKCFENWLPALAGRVGQYPMFVINKPVQKMTAAVI